MEDVLSKIITKYNSMTQGAELEIRLSSVPQNIFKEALKMASGGEVTCSLSEISRGDHGVSYIHMIPFVNGKRAKDKYYKKERIGTPCLIKDYCNFKVVLSKETETAPKTSDTNAMWRFKVRLSKELENGWRLDVTATRTDYAQSLRDGVTSIVSKLLKQEYSNSEELFNELPGDIVSQYEVEFEHMNEGTIKADKNLLTFIKEQTVYPLFRAVSPTFENKREYQDLIMHVAHIMKRSVHSNMGLKALGNRAVSMSRVEYQKNVYPPLGYYVTEKADGERNILYQTSDRKKLYIIGGSELQIIDGETGDIERKKIIGGMPEFTGDATIIADSEYIPSHDIWMLFDCMHHHGENVSRAPIGARIEHLEPIAKELAGRYKKKFAVKNYQCIEDTGDIRSVLESVYKKKYPYEIDGLILTAPGKPYEATMNYKWKPAEMTSIDFLAKKCPNEILGRDPFLKKPGKTLYILFVGISGDVMKRLGVREMLYFKRFFPKLNNLRYRPIQFSSSYMPYSYLAYLDKDDLDGKFVELTAQKFGSDIKAPTYPFPWKYLRTREDREGETGYFGNDYRVAEQVFGDLLDPFAFESLYNLTGSYFRQTRSSMYASPNYYKRRILSELLKDVGQNAPMVLDIGAGRGGDLPRYIDADIGALIAIDIDRTAIAELVSRKFTHPKMRGLRIFAMVADMKTPAVTLKKRIQTLVHPENVSAKLAVANFMFHYLCDTEAHIRNALTVVRWALEKDGYFIITAFNAEAIVALLEKNNGDYKHYEDEVLKYRIKRAYKTNGLANAGQNIEVLLPFSNGDLYSEPLCNFTTVKKVASKCKLAVYREGNFLEFMETYQEHEPIMYNKLTDADKMYIGLHKYMILKNGTA